MQLSHATYFGEYIPVHKYYFHIYQKSVKMGLSPHQHAQLQPNPFNALMSPSLTILTARYYSFMKLQLIPQDENMITFAYFTSSPF